MMEIAAPNLHDFTLLRLVVSWSEKTIAFDLLGPEGACRLTATGLKEIELSRDDSWGPSASVNTIQIARDDEAMLRLTMEMQTGDAIRVRCAYVGFSS